MFLTHFPGNFPRLCVETYVFIIERIKFIFTSSWAVKYDGETDGKVESDCANSDM